MSLLVNDNVNLFIFLSKFVLNILTNDNVYYALPRNKIKFS